MKITPTPMESKLKLNSNSDFGVEKKMTANWLYGLNQNAFNAHPDRLLRESRMDYHSTNISLHTCTTCMCHVKLFPL